MLPLPCRPFPYSLSRTCPATPRQSRTCSPSLLSPKVVARSEIDRTKVQLISGGGSGHEPSHSGWVGKGMLTAAGDFAFFAHPPISPICRTPLFPYLTFYSCFSVAGDIFASPCSTEVLAALMHVRSDAGVLVIVKNYTGDRCVRGTFVHRLVGDCTA